MGAGLNPPMPESCFENVRVHLTVIVRGMILYTSSSLLQYWYKAFHLIFTH